MSLYKGGGFSFVLDGRRHVSVASYHGVEWMDAHVTEFGATGLWSKRRERAPDRTIRERSREPKLHEMMDCRIWKQRREQMLREVERNRRAKALRAVCKRRHGRRSALVWEMKRQAGRLLKFLRRTWRNAGY